MRLHAIIFAASLLVSAAIAQTTQAPSATPALGHADDHEMGFKDTPMLPGLPYHVHDPDRPHAPVVTPDAFIAEPPPPDAEVLFDGHYLSKWEGRARNGTVSEPGWKVLPGGELEVVPTTFYDLATKENYSDIQLHVEWSSPVPAIGSSQGRGNSGVILPGHFEIQVLDMYDNPTYADGSAGAIYGQFPPLAAPTRKPGEWNTYDIVYRAARMDGDKLKTPPSITVIYNGVVVQNNRVPFGPTIYRNVAPYTAKSGSGPITLQNHHNPVRFRNIWVRRLTSPGDAVAQ
jgi:hypothetical protein